MIYAFAINEYHYKRVPILKCRTIESASRKLRRLYKYKGSAMSDFEFYELTKEQLEKWAADCDYDIDWTTLVMRPRE